MQGVSHSACLCSYHENVRLLLVALNKHDKTIPTEFHDFIAKLICNQESEECMFGICCDCPSITILTCEIDYNDISWWQWANDQNGIRHDNKPDMTTILHGWSYGRFIEIQSNIRRTTLHRTKLQFSWGWLS